jgi:hypothetical protein
MSLPGFSAEYGLYRSSRTYQAGSFDDGDHLNHMVVPALCNQTAYDRCIASNTLHLQPGSLEVYCLTQYGCILNGDICVGEGASAHCIFSGQFMCGGSPCPVGHPCCGAECCSPGDSCCGEYCLPPGYQCCSDGVCPNTEQCCPGGTCCQTDQKCCGDTCCYSSQTCCTNACKYLQSDVFNCGSCGHACQTNANCVNGSCVCPVLSAPAYCPPANAALGLGALGSSSNYFLVNGDSCQYIEGLTVSITASETIVSDNGFTVQVNAIGAPGVGLAASQQYVFSITGNSIQGEIDNFTQDDMALIVCGGVDLGSTPISNGLPEGYTLQVTLQYQGVYVSGALFEVLNNGRQISSAQLPVSQTGCNCSLPPGYTCSGYRSAADLSPIAAVTVNIVGPGNGEPTMFTSGAGTINYAVSSGALTAASTLPSCVSSSYFCTVESSNASYGELFACPEQSMTQSFGT